MEAKCLVTVQLGFVEETIRVELQGDSDMAVFKERVLEACRIADARTRVQVQRLIDDSTLSERLDREEYGLFLTAVMLLHPTPAPVTALLTRDSKIEVSKITRTGEVVTLQLHEPGKDFQHDIHVLWDILDTRLSVANDRGLAHTAFLESLPYETQLKLGIAMDAIYGRVPMSHVESRLTKPEVELGEATTHETAV